VADGKAFTGERGGQWRYWESMPLGKPGGFGGVYAAEAADGTPMAVKVVKKQRPQGPPLDQRLLRREVEVGKLVADSGSDMLLPVIDAADDGDALLLVMARAEGGALSGVLPLTEAEAVPALADIATGLNDLHSLFILHRDLKPDNVLSHAGRWKLADFGIARDQEIGTQDPTFAGWGSARYMAPELWEQMRASVKTDLYALGCLAYELLVGAPPYDGDDLAAIRDGHLNQPPPQAPCSDAVLRNLVGRLLAKQPGERPRDAGAVLERLRRALAERRPVQERIARGLGVHADEQARAAAEQSAGRAATEARRQLVAQAKADLREIVSDALSDLQEVEPDAAASEGRDDERGWTDLTFALTAGDVGLSIELWSGRAAGRPSEPAQGDTLVLAGRIMINNPRHPVPLNAANLAYEQAGDHLAWQVYKFAGGGSPARYRYGPYGRTHGLSESVFLNPGERLQMLRPAPLHPWIKTVTLLTADTLLELFQEAVDLEP
jgi:tRNA A-37 threonylcarbamoyl transferase component Bud32